MAKRQAQEEEVQTVQRVMRGTQVHDMDYFKLSLALMTKNMSYKKFVFQPETFEHVHHYRTIKENGQKNQYCSAVGGHFHEIKWATKNGQLVAECGPAMRKVEKKINGNIKTFIQPVQWEIMDMDTGEKRIVKDDHTHECPYVDSQKFSAATKREIQQSNREAIGEVQTKPMKNPEPTTAQLGGEVEIQGL